MSHKYLLKLSPAHNNIFNTQNHCQFYKNFKKNNCLTKYLKLS